MRIKRFREWKKGWRGLALFLFLGIVGITCSLHDVIQANWVHNSLYEMARREGAIVTAQDLRQRYGVEAADNAAPLIVAANQKYDKRSSEERSLAKAALTALLRHEFYSKSALKPDGAKLAAAAAQVRPLTEQLQTLRPVLEKSGFAPAERLDPAKGTAYLELSYLKSIANVAAWQGKELALKGSTDEAFDMFRLGYHVSMLAGDDLGTLPALTEVAAQRVLAEQISLALSQRPQDATLRNGIRAILAKYNQPTDMRRIMDYERFFSWNAVQVIAESVDFDYDTEFSATDRNLWRVSKIPGVQRAWRTRVLEWCIYTNRQMKRTHGDPIATMGNLPAENETPYKWGLSYYTVRNLLDVFSGVAEGLSSGIARSEALLAALDVLDARQKLGRWPDALPVSRRDPFGARTLRYRRDGDGVRVWSIGPDYKDDNGLTKSENRDYDDVVIRL